MFPEAFLRLAKNFIQFECQTGGRRVFHGKDGILPSAAILHKNLNVSVPPKNEWSYSKQVGWYCNQDKWIISPEISLRGLKKGPTGSISPCSVRRGWKSDCSNVLHGATISAVAILRKKNRLRLTACVLAGSQSKSVSLMLAERPKLHIKNSLC